MTSGSQQATDPSSFTVTSTAVPGNIVYNWSAPSIVRPGRISYITITYSNDGASDALAPLFAVSITTGNATIGLPGETSFTGSSVQVLGIENSGPAGTLPPGFQGTLLIPVESTTLTSNASIQVSLQVLTGDSTPIDWSTLESDPAPSLFPTSAWPAIFANLTAEFGSTTESYLSYLDDEASYLSQLGEYTDDVNRLFNFALDTADNALTTATLYSVTDASSPVPGAIAFDFVRQFNATISGRDTMGPLGLGWTDNWQLSASADSTGNVTISDDGSSLYFIKNSDGTYTDAPGDFGTLTLASGAYRFVQTDGTTIAFNTNGSLDFEEDTNGNKVTAAYNASGELTSLTASSGAAIAIAYNAQGLISSITAPGDQTTTYSYDASGQHLLSYTGEFGTTTYAYTGNSDAAGANALTSITLANGTGLQWTYDAQGRIATASSLGGAETETYAYPAPAEFTIMNADGDTSAIFEDDQGNVGETIDPLGNITLYSYDSNNNLTEMVAADGTTTTYAYDANGNLTSETDALGYTIQFTYNTLGEPLTFVNQTGDITSYAYDQYGNLLEQTNPDGTTQQYVYNALGEVTSSTDPDGQTITYAYNANGQLTSENLPGGTSYTYTYDSRGNMLTADGPGDDWSFTYNSANLPTSIVEPFGTLTVQYDIDGNVTQIVDQTGFTENYNYDAVGRLSEVTDGSGNLIESYAYDPAGNLSSETKGNGTSTRYEYDADGDVTEITNVAPGGTTNSQMSYTYDAVGDVTSMTTGGVTTAYSYDADGELVSASAPGDTLLYAYDPDGNRTSVTDNGVVTNYVSNDVNEYTSTTTDGVTTGYQYDANGNLIAATTGGETTAYTFNALNELTGVNGSNGTFAYAYDPFGDQISSTVNGHSTNNLIDPIGREYVLAELTDSGDVAAHFTYGLGLVSQVAANGTPYYYDYNLQGSTVGITNSLGSYVNQYSYDPFGQVTTTSAGISNPFTFVGESGVSSDGNGLIDMQARYYDPSTGQFVSNDPLSLGGGDTNIRRYVQNSPIGSTDPIGLDDDSYWVLPPFDDLYPINPPVQQSPTPIDSSDLMRPPPDPNSSTPLEPADLMRPPQPPDPNSPIPIEPGDLMRRPPANPDNPNVIEPADLMRRYGPKRQIPTAPPRPPANPLGPAWVFEPLLKLPFEKEPSYRNMLTDPPDDPNDLLGPSGYGTAGYLLSGAALSYTIEFSNERTALVPADNVVVTEQLSPNLNWYSFQLGTIGFGSYVVSVPAGLTSYSTRVDATATLGVYVDVDASLNVSTGLLTVTFLSLDPTTLDTPSNPLVGFLPPDTNPPNGEGFINYTIQPKAGLATGASISAQANIVFDTNSPLGTATITNTIDATVPTSTVAPLPATTTSTSFAVSWSGSDGAGPGIAGFNVYVSDNGAAYTLWQTGTQATSATYSGVAGHTYRFYSVAVDPLGLIQPTPANAQAVTSISSTVPPPPPPPPTIVNDGVVTARHEKNGKPVGKPVFKGFFVQFSEPMNPTTTGLGSSYRVYSKTVKKVKKSTRTILKPVAFSVSYNQATEEAMIDLSSTKPFAKGGEIVISGATSQAGAILSSSDSTLTISPNAKRISLA